MEKRILMVCLGNICRSPLAEGAFQDLVTTRGLDARYQIDSAGTGGWHVGDPPHMGSQDIALAHGIDISDQRSRQVTAGEIQGWDHQPCWEVALLITVLVVLDQ